MKKILSLLLAVAMLATMACSFAFAEDKPAGWNDVNAEGYQYPTCLARRCA